MKETPDASRMMNTSSLELVLPQLWVSVLPPFPPLFFLHNPGTRQGLINISLLPRSSWAVSGQSDGSVPRSYWQSSPWCFQPLAGASPGCLRGARPRASPGAFSSQITHPSLQVFFLPFLCTAQFSLLPARIAKTPQRSWREIPGLEHDPTA